jgi:hypothetical protein
MLGDDAASHRHGRYFVLLEVEQRTAAPKRHKKVLSI